MTQGFQLDGSGPRAYERYLVPAFFTPCAAQLLDMAGVGPGERVLDLACGTGIVARRAAARVGVDGAVLGVDVNDGMLAVAVSAAAGMPQVIEWRSGDAAALPLPDAAVDVVCCQQGLQFFTDPALALREACRVLAPGGRVALAVWRSISHHPVFALLAEALGRHAGAEAAGMMRAPFAGPGREDLRRLLTEAGFGGIVARIGVIAVRFPSPLELLRQEVESTPLAGPIGELDARRLGALVDQVNQTLASYMDDDGVTFPMQTWLVTASRPTEDTR